MTNPANFAVLIILVLLAWLVFFPWLRMVRAGASVPMLELVFMSIRKAATPQVLQALGIAQKHGLEVTATQLEVHHLAGGNPLKVVEVMLKYKDRPELTFKQLSMIDLSGEDLEEMIAKGNGPMTIDLFKIHIGTYYIDIKAELRSVYLNGASSTRKLDLESMIKHKLRLAEEPLTKMNYEMAAEYVENQVFGDGFWAENGWVPLHKQVRLRSAY